MADVVLETQNITKTFGSLIACDNVSIELKAGGRIFTPLSDLMEQVNQR